MNKKIRVLIVDDSAIVRQSLTEILSSDPELEVVATASDPYMAVEQIKNMVPDVITLDVEMPKMDGITFLKKIMSQHPIPVIIISTLTSKGTETALSALELGAVEVVLKPQLHTPEQRKEATMLLVDKVKAASHAVIHRRRVGLARAPKSVKPKLTADAVLAKPNTQNSSLVKTTEKIVAVGASTGGTEALKTFLESFPLDSPGIIIVQHMPELFTKQFADRLNEQCKITVKEAVNGDTVLRGQALISPGNKHMLLKRSGAKYFVEITEGPLVNRHRPSVDVLFRSVARYAGKNAVGVIMTGMGNDGAQGLLEMKTTGAFTIAQNEKTCIVFGMPKEAIKLNAVDKIMSIYSIAYEVQHQCKLHTDVK
ncbi:Chemotaxis response regulator protein-glutamate methylesterase CheB [hydrothermal vent metagenome]|uniref:protein-glutamate methylesterase n=1 Tax=hydrothermal vent metagenome TaxID=652676 RepID=A0A3B0UC57_9ZZZZ